MRTIRKAILWFLTAASGGLCGGCHFFAVLASPAAYDIKVPAEYDLSRQAKNRVVIFVEPVRSINCPGLDAELAAAIRAELIKKADIQSDYLFVSGEASPERAKTTMDFRLMSPSQIAKELIAGIIIYVRIEEYQMASLHRERYYTGHLFTRNLVFDDSGNLLWPQEATGRMIRVRAELEIEGPQKAKRQLVEATTHCICRYFYSCPKPDFANKYEEIDYSKDEFWE
jgi:hypothetical protein